MRVILVVLSIVGFFDSTFLVWDALTGSGSCGAFLAGFGISACSDVTTSVYGTWLGYPVSILGMVGYATVGILVIRGGEAVRYRKGIFMVALMGICISAYFVYLQWVVLESWCFFCLLSAGTMTMIFLTSIAFLGTTLTRYHKMGVSDLWNSLQTTVVVLVVVLLLFEVVRGRMLYVAVGGVTPVAAKVEEGSAEDFLVGVIAGKLLNAQELRMLAGSLDSAAEHAAYQFLLLVKETQTTGRPLEEMIHEETTLYLYPPLSDSAELGDGIAGAEGDAFGENNEHSSESSGGEASTAGGVVVMDDAAVYTEGSISSAEARVLAENRFRAYVGFLGRADAKGKRDLWNNFISTLERQYDARYIGE